MRLVEDLPTRRVFEERGREATDCIPEGTMGDDERVLVILLGVIITLIAADFAYDGFQRIQQGNVGDRGVLVTLISTLIFLACVLGGGTYFWRLRRRAVNRVRRYVFDLTAHTLCIDDTASPSMSQWTFSPEKYNTFVVEFVPSCYSVTLFGRFAFRIYSRSEPPLPEFIAALVSIGLHKSDNRQEALGKGIASPRD